jgi:hypothetical protein
MARLPDIIYQSVSPAQTQSPGVEVQKSREKVALVNQAIQGAQDVSDTYAEYDLAKNTAAYSDEMSAFRKEAAKELAVGPEKIIAWGLDKEIDIDGKEVFYKSEWYPLLLSKQMDTTRDKYAAKIKSNIGRTKFMNTVTEQNNKMLESEIQYATEVTKKEHDAMVVADIEVALASGNYDTAMTLAANGGFMPSQRKEIELKVVDAKDNNEIHDLLQVSVASAEKTGSTGGITSLAEYLRSDEARGKYSVGDAQLDQWADRADAAAKGIENDKKVGAEQSKTFARSQMLSSIYDAAHNKSLTYEMIQAYTSNPLMDPGTINTMNRIYENYSESGGQTPHPKVTDPESYISVQTMLDDPDVPAHEALAAVRSNVDKMSESDWQSAVSQATSKGAPKTVERSVYTTRLSNSLVGAGVTKTANPKEWARAMSILNMRFDAAEASGKGMDKATANEAVDEILNEMYRPKIAVEIDVPWSPFDIEGEDIFEAMGEEDAQTVNQILREEGMEPTVENVTRAYNLLRTKK